MKGKAEDVPDQNGTWHQPQSYKNGKRMVNNLVGQWKHMDLNTNHTKEALRKVYRKSR